MPEQHSEFGVVGGVPQTNYRPEDDLEAVAPVYIAEPVASTDSASTDSDSTDSDVATPTPEFSRPQLSLVENFDEMFDSIEDQWQERALCAQTDPEAFFPEKGGSTREAKRICLGCEVKDECLDYALAHDERFGIWGGLSERERRRLKRGIV